MKRVDRDEYIGLQWIEEGPWWAFAVGTAIGSVGNVIVAVGDWVQDLSCLLGWRFVKSKLELISEECEE